MKVIKKKTLCIILIICALVVFGCGGGGGDSWDDIDPGTNTGGSTPDTNPDGTITYYQDQDGDGFGNPDATLDAESLPDGYVTNDDDCNDTEETINPQSDINLISYGTFDSPPIVDQSRQWKFSTTPGGPYTGVISGETASEYTPNFNTIGNYYIVCEAKYDESTDNERTLISNEVLVVVSNSPGDVAAFDNRDPDIDPNLYCSNSISPRESQSILPSTDGIQLSVSRSPVVRLLFHAENALTKELIDGLTDDDITALEGGGTEITCDEHYNNLNHDGVNSNLNIVLLLDISDSISSSDLVAIRGAADELVSNMGDNDLMKIIIFDDRLNMLTGTYDTSNKVLYHDFKSKADILAAQYTNNIEVGHPSTNLFGAVNAGASRCVDYYSSDNANQTFLILITDGTDTTQSGTLESAIDSVKGKRVYTVGVGENADMNVLSQLGTSDSFHLTNFDELKAQLTSIKDLMDDFGDSLYVLEYASPIRAGDVSATINPDNNCVPASFTGTFNADNFHAVSDKELKWLTPVTPGDLDGPKQRDAYCNP